MKNKKTYYLLILDKSGSMQSCADETISGFNEQMQMIATMKERFPEQEYYVSLTTFSDEVSHPFDRCIDNEIRELDRRQYKTHGSTALLDAIGEGVMKLKSTISREIESDEATAVVVILTDGYENASKLFDWKTIRKMIQELESTSSWSFSFMGASADAIEVASRMNIKRSNSMHYSTKEMPKTMNRISTALFEYANEKSMNIKPKDFLKEDF